MSKRLLFGLVIPTGALASVIALLTGDRQAVSLQIWLGCFVVGFTVGAVVHLQASAPLALQPRLPLIKLRLRRWLRLLRKVDLAPSPTDARARRLRVIEGLVVRSRDSGRSFTQQLQPQLVTLATHFLRVNHGVDIERNPTQASRLLGSAAWIIESDESAAATNRTPSFDELETFIRLLEPSTAAGANA